MERIDEKIDNYLNEDGSLALRLMNYVSTITEFIKETENLKDDIQSIGKMKIISDHFFDNLQDAVDDSYVNLVFLKKHLSLLSRDITQTVGGKRLIGR